MIPNPELHAVLTAMRQSEIQREVADNRRALLARSAGTVTPAMQRAGSPIEWLRALLSYVAPGAAPGM